MSGFRGDWNVHPVKYPPRRVPTNTLLLNEKLVLQKINRGLSIAAVARELDMNRTTVSGIIHRARQRFSCVDLNELVKLARKNGWLDGEE